MKNSRTPAVRILGVNISVEDTKMLTLVSGHRDQDLVDNSDKEE